ncbi:MAG: sulfatase-like hydrolase/transferase, partial [Planctomycetota bacterium]
MNTTLKSLVVFVVGPLLSWGCVADTSAVESTSAKQPNIIFIITDDQRRDELGFLGGKAVTPTTDRLANGGMVFENCYVTSSVCTPSRYTVLTGQYASRSETAFFDADTTAEGMTRVTWNPGFMPDQTSLPMVLQDAGYTTGFIGKWHIGGMVRAPGEKIQPGADPADPKVIERLEANQASFAEVLGTRGFDFASRTYAGNPDDDNELKAVGLNIHNMEWLTEGALEFLDSTAGKDEPFFLYFSTTLTHSPKPVQSLRGDPTLTPVGKLDRPITGVQPSREDVMRRARENNLPDELWGTIWLDDGITAIVNKLEELGVADNTMIVYFVDHGSEYQSKGTCYEGGLVAPTFFYMPGTIPAGTTQDALIQNTDFAPTFLEMAGVEA